MTNHSKPKNFFRVKINHYDCLTSMLTKNGGFFVVTMQTRQIFIAKIYRPKENQI